MTRIRWTGSLQGARRLALLLLIAACAVGVAASASAKAGKQTSGVVYASANHTEGDDVYVSGDLKDKLLGRGAIVYVTQVSAGPEAGTLHVEASKITIYTTKGSLTGKGEADQTFNADGTSTVDNGTFALKRGTGAYKDHTLVGTFTGTYLDGVYKFDYKGTYK